MAAEQYRRSVNEKTYHHGDLRTALIDAGMATLRTGEDLSLRALARSVGVSATAVYRHFPDKDALLAAIAEEAYAMLAADQRAASEAAGGGLAGFGATGAAYVRFALKNPALFRLVFAHVQTEPHEKRAEEDEAMAMLHASAATYAPAGVDPRIAALQAWSLVHGLAMLMLDGHVPAEDALIDRVIDAKLLGWRA
jgi:AcrR family transcriptional regulator